MEKKLVQPDGRLENPLLRSILSSTFSIFSFWILEVFLSSIKTRADTFIAFQQFYNVLNCCCETLEQQNTTLFSYQISYLKIHVQAKKKFNPKILCLSVIVSISKRICLLKFIQSIFNICWFPSRLPNHLRTFFFLKVGKFSAR